MIQPVHTIILVIISLFLSFAVYDEFILRYRKGKTLLSVYLKRANRLDGTIFIGLVCIVFYQQGAFLGDPFAIYLLGSLLLLSTYVYFIRKPKFILKEKGFFFADVFIPYERIHNMHLTEDGVLVIALEVKKLFVQVCELDDLEKIYHIFTGLNYTHNQSEHDTEKCD